MPEHPIPTTHEINAIFGDGEAAINRPLKYYLRGMVARPNSITHEFSNDSNLYRKGWWIVLFSVVIGLLVGPGIEHYAYLTGWITNDQLFENLGYSMIGSVLIPPLYLLSRWIWIFVFRFGTRFSDRRIAAATALSFAIVYFVTSPILFLLQAAMLSAGLPGWIPGENLYEQTSTLAIILGLLLSIIIPGFYYSDALDISFLKAMAWNFLSYVLVFASLLLPFAAYITVIQ